MGKYGADWQKFKSELVVRNFQGTEIERYEVISALGLERESDLYGTYYGQEFWERNLDDNKLKKLIDFHKSGLVFLMEFFRQESESWVLIKEQQIPYEKFVHKHIEIFEQKEKDKKAKIKIYVFSLLFIALITAVSFVVNS